VTNFVPCIYFGSNEYRTCSRLGIFRKLIPVACEQLLSQCESQVLKLPSFAFALAQVIVNVASQVGLWLNAIISILFS
jgi:hypothetical protein